MRGQQLSFLGGIGTVADKLGDATMPVMLMQRIGRLALFLCQISCSAFGVVQGSSYAA